MENLDIFIHRNLLLLSVFKFVWELVLFFKYCKTQMENYIFTHC